MKLNDLVATQRKFDEKHGWTPRLGDHEAMFQFLQEDVVGLAGEVGEIANIAKRIALEKRRDDTNLPDNINAALPELSEEITDCLIYLVRMASYLNVDLSAAYAQKLQKNEERFKRYEHPSSE